VILAITLVATVWPSLQGILLTVETLGFFIAAMMLMPKIKPALFARPERPESTETASDSEDA
jgi:hypothetical protein